MTTSLDQSLKDALWVLGDIEVKLTGRVAERRVTTSNSTARLVEVSPADPDNGTWKKWVALNSMYRII